MLTLYTRVIIKGRRGGEMGKIDQYKASNRLWE